MNNKATNDYPVFASWQYSDEEQDSLFDSQGLTDPFSDEHATTMDDMPSPTVRFRRVAAPVDGFQLNADSIDDDASVFPNSKKDLELPYQSPLSPFSRFENDHGMLFETSDPGYMKVNPRFYSNASPEDILTAIKGALSTMDVRVTKESKWDAEMEFLCVGEVVQMRVEVSQAVDDNQYVVDFYPNGFVVDETMFLQLCDHIQMKCADVDASDDTLKRFMSKTSTLDAFYDANQSLDDTFFEVDDEKLQETIGDIFIEWDDDIAFQAARDLKNFSRHPNNRQKLLSNEKLVKAIVRLLDAECEFRRLGLFTLIQFEHEAVSSQPSIRHAVEQCAHDKNHFTQLLLSQLK